MPPADVRGAKAKRAPARPAPAPVSDAASGGGYNLHSPAPAPGAVHRPVASPVFGALKPADRPIRQALHQATQSVAHAQQSEPSPPSTPRQQQAFNQVAGEIRQTIHSQHLAPPQFDPVIRADLASNARAAHQNKPFDIGKVKQAINFGLPEAQGLANLGGTIFRRDNQDKSVLQDVVGLGATPVPLDPAKGGVYIDPGKIPKGARVAQSSMATAADPVKSSALFALNQVTRPVHAITTGLDAAVTGGDPLAGAAKGFLHTNQAVIGSQLLRHLGVHNKALAAIGGFGVDVGLDPTTYLSGGASIPAKEAAKAAAETAARDAAQAAASEGPRAAAQAESAAYQKAYEQTFAAHPGKARGISVGGRVHVPLTNITLQGKTGALGSTLFADARHRLGEAARQGGTKATAVPSAISRAASHVTPQMRPPGFTDAQWETMRQGARVFRGNTNARERIAMEHAQGLHRSLGPGANPNFVAGMETPGPLTREQQALHNLLNQTADELQAHSAIRGRVGGAPNPVPPQVADLIGPDAAAALTPKNAAARFFPHTAMSELEPKGAKLPGRPGGASASSFTSGKHRRYVEPIHLQTNNAAEHFSTNVPAVVGHYLTKAGRRIEGSDYWNRIAGLGKVLEHGNEADLKPGEMVYKVDAQGLHPIESKLEPGTVNEAKVRRALARTGEHSDPADKFVVLPGHLVEQAKTMVQRGSGSEHAFTKAYDTVLGQTKAFQTIRNPAYQLTNFSGDGFMARQAGATTRDFLDARTVSQEAHRESAHRSSAAAAQGEKRAASDATVHINGEQVPAAEIVDRFRKQGLQEGHVVDIQDVLGHQLKSTRLRRFNTARELYPRYATFISGLKRGMSDQQAAKLVTDHHFDYSDLTPAERGLRRVIPFYTFARRNAGLQARKIVSNPRVQSHFQLAREEAAAAQGQPKDWEKTLRGYERQGLPFPLPGGNLLFSRMPLTDLNQLTLSPQTALRNVTTRTAPLITMPFQLATNRDFFFNQPINPNDPATNRVQSGAKGLVPAPNIPGLTPLLEKMGVIHPIQDTHGKGMVPGWNPYIPFLLRSLPQTNYAQQIASNSPGTNHGVSAGLSLFNLATGLKISQHDSAKEAYTQALTYSNLLQSKLNDAVQRGDTGGAAKLKQEMQALQKTLPELRKAAGYPTRPRTRRKSSGGGSFGASAGTTGSFGGSASAAQGSFGGG